MIVKFIGNKGGGSAKVSFDYLLGKDRERENAKILEGDPDITQKLADNLEFKNKYTVGVLSFEEENLPEKDKFEIIDQFEKTTFAGLDKDQYSICWIEHRDKGRLELNFVVANVELKTQKRLQPYYDKVDRKHINNFQNVINHKYNLSDPHDPEKKQLSNSLSVKNLPKKTAEIKNSIDKHITKLIESDVIKNRDDVIEVLKSAGFEISRTTDNSISLKNPDPEGRNIRLKGAIYEDRKFSGEFEKEHGKACTEYRDGREDNYRKSLQALERGIEKKREENNRKFKTTDKPHLVADLRLDRDSFINSDRITSLQLLPMERNGRLTNSEEERREIYQSENEHQQIEVMGENRVSNDRRRPLYSGKRKTGTLYIEERQHSNKSPVTPEPESKEPIKAETTSNNSFDINVILEFEKLKRERKEQKEKTQINKKEQSKMKEVFNYAKQFYSKCREFINRTGQRKPEIIRAERDINEIKQSIDRTEPSTRECEQVANKFAQDIGKQQPKINRTDRELNERKSTLDLYVGNINKTVRDIKKENNLEHKRSYRMRM